MGRLLFDSVTVVQRTIWVLWPLRGWILTLMPLVLAGCTGGDDGHTLALIKRDVTPIAIHSEFERGGEYIVSLGLPNSPLSLPLLPHLAKLHRLSVLLYGYNDLKDDDLSTLPPLPNLRELTIGHCRVTDEGLKYLRGMTGLKRLNLCSMQIKGPGLAYLSELSNLEILDLSENPLDDSAIPIIVKNFRKLKRFDFCGTCVTTKGFLQLAQLPWLEIIGGPDAVFGDSSDLDSYRRNKREVLRQYNKDYNEYKQKARNRGEEVPRGDGLPFNTRE